MRPIPLRSHRKPVRGRRWWVAAGLLAAAVPLASSGPAGAASGPCARFGPMAVAGHVGDSRVVELSGLAASRRHAGVLWAHNDSGGAAEVYAMGLDGGPRGAYPLTGATATDWEDIAVGPGPGSASYLYVGDIGDNGASRASVTVYRVPEPATAPSGAGAALSGVEAIQLKYPAGPADAEALLVDPRTGDLVIVTKALSGKSRVLVAPASALHAGPVVTMSDQGTITIPQPSGGSGLPGTMVTGGDISPDGSTIALRTYRSVLLYSRGSGSVASALKGSSCFGPQAQEPQGEAVGFTRDGAALLTASEGNGVPIYRSGPAPAPPASGKGTTTTVAPGGGGPSSRITTTTSPPHGTQGSTTTDPSSTTTTSRRDERAKDRKDGGDDDDADRAEEATAPSAADGGSSGGGGGRPAAAAAVAVGFGATAGAIVWMRRRRSAAG